MAVFADSINVVLRHEGGYTTTEADGGDVKYGISRKTGYKWVYRFEEGGLLALDDRKRRPHSCPHQTEQAVVEAITGAGHEPVRAAVEKHASSTVALEGSKVQSLLKLLDGLDDNEDVQNVWANFDISDKDLEQAAAG